MTKIIVYPNQQKVKPQKFDKKVSKQVKLKDGSFFV